MAFSKRNQPKPRPKRNDGAGRKSVYDEKARQAFAIRKLMRPKSQASLNKKLDDMSIHPSIYNLLLVFGFGKPTEMIETKEVTPVRIVHEYDDGEPKK